MSILKILQEKDRNGGAYFLEPVDPVAHNIPNYHQIITNPMDLGTIQAKMDANEVESPEEFARLMRLVFENAVKFNSNPMNFVHQTARAYLSIFNQKFRDVERLLTEKKKPTTKEMKEQKRKQQKEEKKRLDKEKKRKREEEEDPKTKQLSLLRSTSEEVGKSLDALNTATAAGTDQSPTVVTRNEFMVMTNVIRQIHTQLSHVQTMIQLMTTPNAAASTSASDANSTTNSTSGTEAGAPKKPRRTKKPSKTTKQAAPEPVAPVAPPAPALASPAEPVRPIEEEPLTHEEQEELTSAINEMTDDKIQMVIDIIKKSKSNLIDDDQEIELDLDQIDTSTQRKLLKFALKVCCGVQQRVIDMNSFINIFSHNVIPVNYRINQSQSQLENHKRVRERRTKILLLLLHHWNQSQLLNHLPLTRRRMMITDSDLAHPLVTVKKRRMSQLKKKPIKTAVDFK